MGLIPAIMTMLFGNGRNVISETLDSFRENPEAGAARDATARGQAMAQYSAEFSQPRRGLFDRLIDGLNRLPRPLLAFGTLGLFVSAMVDPLWFASRMQGIALVPEPLWWLMGAIVSFYFGARAQAKGQEFQRSIAENVSRTAEVTRSIRAIEALQVGATLVEDPLDAVATERNPALEDWSQSNGR